MIEKATTRLTEEEIARYECDGILVPDFRISDEVLDRMREALERLTARNRHMTTDIMICPHLSTGGTQGLEGGREWLDFAANPDLLDMAEQLIGPDIILWGTTVFGKPPATGKETPWHQDARYWPIRPLATCSVWIALDASTPENGCLRVIPGTHEERRIFGHETKDRGDYTLNKELAPTEFDADQAQNVVLEPGQVSLHDAFLVHGSKPNRSDKRRAGYVLRLMPAASRWDRVLGADMARGDSNVDFAKRQLYLLRGEDRSGQNDAIRPRAA